ncbi:MAG: hypothetical protein IKJ02_03505, partial [Tidjanibacter sp.]|nr:hypothetical protein [Tidjanibacter sp.]
VRELREFRENRLDSLSNNCFSSTTFSVILGFSGLGYTLEESTNEIEIWVCRVYSNKTHISILFVVTTK